VNSFIPEMTIDTVTVPFFEDVKADVAPGYRTRMTPKALQKEISDLLLRMGAGAIRFMPGQYPGKPTRYGFQLTFSLNGIPGRIDIAALPMRTETAAKKDSAQAQALFLVRDWLRGELFSSLYRPGAVPLMPYLIGPGGKTVTEAILEDGRLPALLGSGT
jgi:hypothetical protein